MQPYEKNSVATGLPMHYRPSFIIRPTGENALRETNLAAFTFLVVLPHHKTILPHERTLINRLARQKAARQYPLRFLSLHSRKVMPLPEETTRRWYEECLGIANGIVVWIPLPPEDAMENEDALWRYLLPVIDVVERFNPYGERFLLAGIPDDCFSFIKRASFETTERLHRVLRQKTLLQLSETMEGLAEELTVQFGEWPIMSPDAGEFDLCGEEVEEIEPEGVFVSEID